MGLVEAWADMGSDCRQKEKPALHGGSAQRRLVFQQLDYKLALIASESALMP